MKIFPDLYSKKKGSDATLVTRLKEQGTEGNVTFICSVGQAGGL